MSSVVDAGRGASLSLARRRGQLLAAARSPAAPWAALAVLVIGTGALLFHETRGTTLWFDEWTWLLHRRGGSLSTFLDSHDGHFSLIPIAIYKLLFATVGIRHSAPYRAVMIPEHLGICVLLSVYARRRVGPVLALVLTALLLLFGPGWENLLWPFQISWNTSLLAGLGALLALDRRDRAGEIAACVLLVVSLASSGLGVPIVIGVVVEALLARRPLGAWWVLLAPIALYVLWAIPYQHTVIVRHAFVAAPSFVATGLASTFSGLAGLGRSTGLDRAGTLITWGPSLLIVGILAAAWRVLRVGRLEPRVAGLTATALAFWLITALTRALFANPYSSRYLYVSALFVVLLAAELLRGVPMRWRAEGLVAVLALGAVVSNLGALRDAARLFRDDAVTTRADLGAVEIAKSLAPAGYLLAGLPGYPFVQVYVGQYLAAERSVGTPAAAPAQIAADPESARETADTELARIHAVALRPGAERVGHGSCVTFAAAAVFPPGAGGRHDLTLPPGGVRISANGAPVAVGVRRFASSFKPIGTLTGGASATLAIAQDDASQPWHVLLAGDGPVSVCQLAG